MTDLLSYPVAGPAWELAEASPVRIFGKSVWADPLDQMATPRMSPLRSVMGSGGPIQVDRIGIRRGAGYHKCASDREFDVPRRLRLAAHDSGTLKTVADLSFDQIPPADDILWTECSIETDLAVVYVDESFIDGQWPSWNLAQTGVVLEGRPLSEWTRRPLHQLSVSGSIPAHPAEGVTATTTGNEVRFKSAALEIGFRLRSPSLSYFSIDEDRGGATHHDLLQHARSMDIVRAGIYPAGVYPVLRDSQAHYLALGPRLTLIDGATAGGITGFDFEGSVGLDGNTVTYNIRSADTGVGYWITWTVEADRLTVDIGRSQAGPLPAWLSSAWHIATNNKVAASTVLGTLLTRGETGSVTSPATWHFPGYGSLDIESSGDVMLRSDSVRPLDTNTLEIKVGETPLPDGSYLIEDTGPQRVEMQVRTPRLAGVSLTAPTTVKEAVEKRWVTALTFRADTGTFSNNGASMHCAGSLNPLADIVSAAPQGERGVDPVSMLEQSISRWLRRAPGYGSGNTSRGDFDIEDEYLMLGTDALYACGRLLSLTTPGWFREHDALITEAWRKMAARDRDGDGLIESEHRRGISGEHQWSTTWADVVSFGWKDSWTNATLYGALTHTAAGLRRHGRDAFADDLDEWSGRLRERYLDEFFNEERGWIGGWRSADGVLHDYCFPLINGDAVAHGLVTGETAREVMQAVWWELARVGYSDFANGIPINLHPIAEEDIGGVVFGLPIGGYIQGGATHHRTGGFVKALYIAEMTEEGDTVLSGLCSTVASAEAFGGVGSGVDWRFWDGSPSGYEGLLAEGFGFLSVALDRYPISLD